jgi:hypothetical protein
LGRVQRSCDAGFLWFPHLTKRAKLIRRPANPKGPKTRTFYPSATDGFWVMLAPLPPGDHHLAFRAFYTNQGAPGGDAVQNISYELLGVELG